VLERCCSFTSSMTSAPATAIVSSGYADNSAVSVFPSYGVGAYLPKPFHLGILLQSVPGPLMNS
jgi:hypothetical protein